MIPLRLEHITKRFAAVTAVDDVSLAVEPGELFFLLGPSGCGKTTLLRIVAGFYEPDAGRVFFGERDVTDLAPHRRRCGMVFQNYALWPHMTVLENVAFGLAVRGIGRTNRRRRALEMLSVVQMADYARRRPTQLSGGQQQRVALARALVIQPDFLLLDEPLSNLDAKLRVQMRAEIQRIQRSSAVTSVYVTHDQDEALALADRLAVVRDGRVVALGRPRDLYLDPPTAWVAGFLGATNLLDGTVRRREGAAAEIETPLGLLRAASALEDLAPLTAVTVSIRPEAMRLLAPAIRPEGEGAAPAENVFAATVLSRTFQGETEQARVRVGSEKLILSYRPTTLPPVALRHTQGDPAFGSEAQARREPGRGVAPGEPARIHIPADAVRVFAREAAPAAAS